MTKEIIQLTHVSKVFETEDVRTHALDSVFLSIARGEYLAVSGPSGCGKSTLLSILGLLERPTSGQYLLNGQDVTTLGGKAAAQVRNREIGFIFQSFNLLAELTVAQNVELPLRYRAMSASERGDSVNRALDRVGMLPRAKHYPSQLSGGQQQRVAVARAVAGNPAIVLADEPTGNLDSKNGEAVMELLSGLHAAGATICIVTHDARYAEHAGRIVHLLDGRVLYDTSKAGSRSRTEEGTGDLAAVGGSV